ncbi:MAG: hypothetical protein ACSI46_14340 [Gloeotrichia echinulata DVL01]|jgi:hypothetical protein
MKRAIQGLFTLVLVIAVAFGFQAQPGHAQNIKIKVITTAKFEMDHLAKNSKEALDKAKRRNEQFSSDNYRVFHFFPKGSEEGFEGEVISWMKGGKVDPTDENYFQPPGPQQGWLQYNTTGLFTIWEWCGKKPDKIELSRKPKLTLGIASYDPGMDRINPQKARKYPIRKVGNEKRVDVYIHHFEGTIPPAICP